MKYLVPATKSFLICGTRRKDGSGNRKKIGSGNRNPWGPVCGTFRTAEGAICNAVTEQRLLPSRPWFWRYFKIRKKTKKYDHYWVEQWEPSGTLGNFPLNQKIRRGQISKGGFIVVPTTKGWMIKSQSNVRCLVFIKVYGKMIIWKQKSCECFFVRCWEVMVKNDKIMSLRSIGKW